MDIERLIGVTVTSVEAVEVGEIVGIEVYGSKIFLILDSNFEFGGPDGDGGQEIPARIEKLGDFSSESIEKGDNIVAFRKRG